MILVEPTDPLEVFPVADARSWPGLDDGHRLFPIRRFADSMLVMPQAATFRHFGILPVVLALVMGIACGGSSGPPAGSIKVSMTEFAFTPKDISAPTGKVVFFLTNAGQTSHDMVVLDSSGKQVAKSDLVQPGNDSLFTIDNLPAGSYAVVCDVQGHRAAGMVGTLTVT